MVEFTLSSIVLIPLLLGVFVFGFRLIRAIEMQQITRDLGHMYLERIDFRNAGPQQNAQTLASGFNLTGTGTSLVVLEQVKIEQQTDCDNANVAPPGTPCPNLNQPVFIEQLTIGNTTAGKSAFGTPPLLPNLMVSVVSQAVNPAAVAQGFSTYLSLKPGEIAYVSEMINLTPELNVPGFSGEPQVYARSIF
jgi:hypothetical protein